MNQPYPVSPYPTLKSVQVSGETHKKLLLLAAFHEIAIKEVIERLVNEDLARNSDDLHRVITEHTTPA